MQSYTLLSGAGLAGLTLTGAEPRSLGSNDVRAAIRAAALNFRDLQIARGGYPGTPPHPVVPLSDGVGEVVEVGSSVTRLSIGDRVITTFWPEWIDGPITPPKLAVSYGAQIDGTLARELVAHEAGLARAPSTVSDAGAAAIPCAGVTAWNALFVQGAAPPGDTVLILGTGGVATWALQLAVTAGLNPIVTSSSDAKLKKAEKMGARALINYQIHPEWHHEVLSLTHGRGAELVLEVGGEQMLPRSIAATRFGGRVIVVGGLSGFGAAGIEPHDLIFGAKTLSAVAVGSRAMTEDLVRFIELHGIAPVIDSEFAFADARAAYEHFEAGTAIGKVVISVQ